MQTKMPFNFGAEDNNTQQWGTFRCNGIDYDLSHLDAHVVNYTDSSSGSYTFYVTYSHHCFCKTEEWVNDDHDWLFQHNKDPRHFNLTRYALSQKLPSIIENLPSAITYHAGYDSYAVYEILDGTKVTYYHVAFSVFRSARKFRLHVKSAYPIDARPKVRKVAFLKIAKALKEGRKLPKP